MASFNINFDVENFNINFTERMALLVQSILNKIIPFAKKLHKVLVSKWVDAFMWIALLFVDPLLYYAPTVDSENIAFHVDRPLLITIWVLYLPLVAYRIYMCLLISRRNRVIIISAEIILGVIDHALSLRALLFRPALEIPNPWSVVIMFLVVGAYLGRSYAAFKWFVHFGSQIPFLSQNKFTLWMGALIYFYGGYIFGSFWYYLAVSKKLICWKRSCRTLSGCYFSPSNLFTVIDLKAREMLIESCSVNTRNEVKVGFFKDAFLSGIIEHVGLWKRVFICLRWGVLTMCTIVSAHMNYNWDEWESAFVISIVMYVVVTIGFFMSSLSLVPREPGDRGEHQASLTEC